MAILPQIRCKDNHFFLKTQEIIDIFENKLEVSTGPKERTAEGEMDDQMNFLAIISRLDNPNLQLVIEEFDETISFLFDSV